VGETRHFKDPVEQYMFDSFPDYGLEQKSLLRAQAVTGQKRVFLLETSSHEHYTSSSNSLPGK